jgi:hypothetical protein
MAVLSTSKQEFDRLDVLVGPLPGWHLYRAYWDAVSICRWQPAS